MKNLKVRSKLLLAFSIVLIVFLLCINTSILGTKAVQNIFNDFFTGSYVTREAAMQLQENFAQEQLYIYRALGTQDATAIKENESIATQIGESIQKESIPKLKGSLDEKSLGIMLQLEQNMISIKGLRQTVLEYAVAGDTAPAAEMMEKRLTPLFSESSEMLNTIIATVNEDSNGLTATISTSMDYMFWIMLFSGVLCFLICGFFALYITRSITKPIAQIQLAAEQMSEGNLKVNLDYRSKDELGHLAHSMRKTADTLDSYISDIGSAMHEMESGNFNVTPNPAVVFKGDFIRLRDSIVHMVFSLSQAFRRVSESTKQVSSGAQQLSDGSQTLSRGTTEQAAAVQEFVATVDEISHHGKRTAENALTANQKTVGVSQLIVEGNEQMQRMVSAISEINTASTQIGKIIKTIEDIAFQTNILALNAAVEAARAGTAGKGFAVVAAEVRNLASKSATAAKDSTALIESSIQAVANGTHIANLTAQSLRAIVSGVQEVGGLVNVISKDSSAQADSIAQLLQGLEQISCVVQTNAAAAEESASVSEELMGLSTLLRELVAQFKLPNETSSTQADSSNVLEAEQSIV